MECLEEVVCFPMKKKAKVLLSNGKGLHKRRCKLEGTTEAMRSKGRYIILLLGLLILLHSWAFSYLYVSLKPSDTIIIMADNRPPQGNRNYWSLALALNLRYACHQGYDFTYYLLVGGSTDSKLAQSCSHARLGTRSSPWCKLPAIAHALSRGYKTVVFIDSDAFFSAQTVSVDSILRKYGKAFDYTNATLVLPSNQPWKDYHANTGLQIWKNRPHAMTLLKAWWDVDTHAKRHAFEQSGLEKLLIESPTHLSLISTVRVLDKMRILGAKAYSEVIHIGSNQNRLRLPTMLTALQQAAEVQCADGCILPRAQESIANEVVQLVNKMQNMECQGKTLIRLDATHVASQLLG